MINIDFIFSIGYRCNSSDFLKKYQLRSMSGPFDYMFIDIETAFDIIYDDFKNFLTNIVVVNKNNKTKELYYNAKSIDQRIHTILDKNIRYMRHDYNNTNLIINQNYIDKTHSNIYEWNRICIFHHHDIRGKITYDTIQKRVNRFKDIYENKIYQKCLFYITRIVDTNHMESYKNIVRALKKQKHIDCYIIIIICSDRFDDDYAFEDDILFIIKRVESYDQQLKKYHVDNDINFNYINFDKEYSIIKKIFHLNHNVLPHWI